MYIPDIHQTVYPSAVQFKNNVKGVREVNINK